MLHIQDPHFSLSYSTHEALIATCAASNGGFGAFAFASEAGIRLLFEDEAFSQLLARGEYFLIVGIDEITNVAALNALEILGSEKPTLTIKVFMHAERTLFHPKFSFFKNEGGAGHLVIGSGNLTIGGLRQNRECFANVSLTEADARTVIDDWQLWIRESEPYLKEVDDPAVLERAKQNAWFQRRKKEIKEEETDERSGRGEEEAGDDELEGEGSLEPDADWRFKGSSRVLVAEIPRSGNRWKQANFDRESFVNFFGADPGNNSQRVIFRHVGDAGRLSEIEVRTSVSVRSQNYRFELEAAAGLDYPEDGPPIAVFVEIGKRLFLYQLFMPGSAQYESIYRWLEGEWTGRDDRMKRITTIAADIDNAMQEAALWMFRD